MNLPLLRPFTNVEGLQRRYSWAMNALPIIFMVVGVAAVPLGFLLAIGIDLDAPMLQQPWGWWILVPVLVSLVLGVAMGWLLGVLMTIALARLLGWTWRQGLQVFWFKNVPEHWLLPEWRGDESFGLREAQRKWDEERKKGMLRGIIRRGAPWALTMFFGVGLFPVLNNPAAYDWGDVAYRALIWTVCGAFFGWVTWLTDSRPK
jgi:hypothetical protein